MQCTANTGNHTLTLAHHLHVAPKSVLCKQTIFGKQECFNVTMPRPLQVFCRHGHSCLGSYLDASAAAGPEICKRLGEAKGQFEKLPKVWQHSTLRTQLKIRIFQGCVVSKLLHCPHTMWLNKADVRKIDGFPAKSPRSILRLLPPYINCNSNATVLQRGRCKRLSAILKLRQVPLFQSIATVPDDDLRRICIFEPNKFTLQSLSAPRKGAPQTNLGFRNVYRMAAEIARGPNMLDDLLRDAAKWRSNMLLLLFSAKVITPLVFPPHVSQCTKRMNE